MPFVCNTGKYLRFGDNEQDKMCLSETKLSARGVPSLTFKIKGKNYYLGLSRDESLPVNEESTKKMRVLTRGVYFNVFDASVLP